jgi:YD repeat-containing protein
LLAAGTLDYLPAPDLFVHNGVGTDIIFGRCYRSERALHGYGSPGLAEGWVDNYDIVVHSSKPDAWSALTLIYPTGAQEVWTPELDASHRPTGKFQTQGGVPYVVTGDPDRKTGLWKDITVEWKDQAQWIFMPSLDRPGVYVLRSIAGLVFLYDSAHRLKSVHDVDSDTPLLRWDYDSSGYLVDIVDSTGRKVLYHFGAAVNGHNSLLTVSTVTTGNTAAPDRYRYGYVDLTGHCGLGSISVPFNQGTRSSCSIQYQDGRVSSFTDANGASHVYSYAPGATDVQLKEATGKVLMHWQQKWDELGRNTGTTRP